MPLAMAIGSLTGEPLAPIGVLHAVVVNEAAVVHTGGGENGCSDESWLRLCLRLPVCLEVWTGGLAFGPPTASRHREGSVAAKR